MGRERDFNENHDCSLIHLMIMNEMGSQKVMGRKHRPYNIIVQYPLHFK